MNEFDSPSSSDDAVNDTLPLATVTLERLTGHRVLISRELDNVVSYYAGVLHGVSVVGGSTFVTIGNDIIKVDPYTTTVEEL